MVANSRITEVRAAMWLSTTDGEDEMKGRSCRSSTPYPSKPSSSASTALSTTSRSRSVVDLTLPVIGSGSRVIRLTAMNFMRSQPRRGGLPHCRAFRLGAWRGSSLNSLNPIDLVEYWKRAEHTRKTDPHRMNDQG